jgi:hypothetical protein
MPEDNYFGVYMARTDKTRRREEEEATTPNWEVLARIS